MAATIPAIDGDGHVFEQMEAVRPYLDKRWSGRDTRLWPHLQPWDTFLNGRITSPYGYSPRMPADEQVALWNRILDDHGIDQVILFPTSAGSVTKLQERDFANDVARAVNRHFATDYQTGRLHPVGVLPMRDPEAAAREVEYATTELGLKGFEILPDSLPFGLGDPFYDPVYEAAQACGATIAIHGGRVGANDWGGQKLAAFGEVHAYAFIAGIMLNFTSVLCQGLPVRFPELRLGFLEVGATWLPYYLDRLDEHWEKRGAEEMPLLDRKPSQLFRSSRIKVSIEGKETLLRETIDFVGVEHLIYATDIPHWDGEFPENLEDLRAANNLSAAEKQAILRDNARALYAI